jgi:branched-chain amino acid aminotransferase
MKIYIDGKYYDKDNALISVFDHGLLYGDGVFEGIRIYNGKVFRLKEHIKRLYMSAKAIMLNIPMNATEMEKTVIEAVKVNNKENGYIRLVVTRGMGPLGINPMQCPRPSIIIIVGDIELYPGEYYRNGIKIITSSARRISADVFDVRIKSLNYLNNVLAKMEAIRSGCLEAVMLNRGGLVAGCTGGNIFIVENLKIFTPAPVNGALDGITKDTVIELAKRNGINALETALTQYDLYNADECFLTGTGAQIIPVIQIDGRQIADGKPGTVTLKLMDAFEDYIRN